MLAISPRKKDSVGLTKCRVPLNATTTDPTHSSRSHVHSEGRRKSKKGEVKGQEGEPKETTRINRAPAYERAWLRKGCSIRTAVLGGGGEVARNRSQKGEKTKGRRIGWTKSSKGGWARVISAFR